MTTAGDSPRYLAVRARLWREDGRVGGCLAVPRPRPGRQTEKPWAVSSALRKVGEGIFLSPETPPARPAGEAGNGNGA